ncbi:PAS domain-containing sensor histidine kinase [Halogeometricum limi]|uniref:histidine kinase n=1 Tax=Halogeometricum limi TaxID=555875 RepID=A0A1I6IRA7_9EURY|nr:PAS domain-containing sensor histidine kinase [Halogeometricum limi]SFR69248.1 PAS domain S-box-containing protein [Halogeometricum limi]
MGCREDATLPPAFDDLEIGIILHDPETGVILDANERLETLYGYALDDLRQTTVDAYTPPSTKFTQSAALRRIRAAAEGDTQTFEWQLERSNGELRWVRVHLNRTTIDEEAYVIAEIEDITQYRSRERRLRLLSRIVRHNLRNQTNILIGYAERVESAVENDSLESELRTIVDVASDVGALSESVTQLERIAEPDATERSSRNLRTTVEDAVRDVEPRYPDATITVEAPTDVWAIVDDGVDYAISHALENAVEHNDRDRPTVTVTVDSDGDEGVVRVADNGPPIPDTEIDVLRDDVEASSTYHGSGVGLWVMQWCADSLGGALRFEENSPRGNVVSICLPLTDQAGANS